MERTDANQENRLINSNGLLPKCRSRKTAAVPGAASFRTYPRDLLQLTVALLPKFGTSQRVGHVRSCVQVFLYFSHDTACTLAFPSRSLSSLRSRASFLEFALSWTIKVSSDRSWTVCAVRDDRFRNFSPASPFLPPSIRPVYPTENHRRCGTFGISSNLTFV